jgi:hypothetical protein
MGGGHRNGALRHPGATCRGVGGHQAVSMQPLLGTSIASDSYRSLSFPVCRHGTEDSFGRPPPHAPADSDGLSLQLSSLAPPLDAMALVLEQMALINSRMDAQAATIAAHRHREAQRDTPRTVPPTTPSNPSQVQYS